MKDLTYFWAGIISVILIALAVWVSFFAPFAHAPKKPLAETTPDASLKPKEESIIKEEELAPKEGLTKTLSQASPIQEEEPPAPLQKQETDLKDKIISLTEKLKNNDSDIFQAAADELVKLRVEVDDAYRVMDCFFRIFFAAAGQQQHAGQEEA